MPSREAESLTLAALIEKKRRHLMPCLYNFYREPLWIRRAHLQYVFDERDRRYLDCYSGVGVVNCGHCNPAIVKAVSRALETLDHTTTIYLTAPAILLAERLAQIAPGDLQQSFFCSSGSEANDGAAVLAMLATGRSNLIALDRSLHGRTLLTMNLNGLEMWRTDRSLETRVLHVPTPDCHRCPYGLSHPSCELHCAHEAARLIEAGDPGSYAAMFIEPVLGNGGVVVPPPGYLAQLKEALDRHGILLVADEMQTGFGRTGKLFGIEHHGVEPAIMTMAKALGNGVPVGAFLAAPEIAAAYTKPGASTFGGNGASMAAGHAVLDFIFREGLVERAAQLGERLRTRLLDLAQRHARWKHVRGLGLMLGGEIVDSSGGPDGCACDRILEAMKDRGFLAGKTGPHRNILTFMPPLIVEPGDIDDMAAALDESLTTLEATP